MYYESMIALEPCPRPPPVEASPTAIPRRLSNQIMRACARRSHPQAPSPARAGGALNIWHHQQIDISRVCQQARYKVFGSERDGEGGSGPSVWGTA